MNIEYTLNVGLLFQQVCSVVALKCVRFMLIQIARIRNSIDILRRRRRVVEGFRSVVTLKSTEEPSFQTANCVLIDSKGQIKLNCHVYQVL